MADVFISYSSEETAEAEKIAKKLEQEHIRCWMAHRDIPGGSYYAAEIPEAISKCKVFLLLMSEKAKRSEYVLSELNDAVDKKKLIIPFYLSQTKLDDRFQFFLKRYQHIEAFPTKRNAVSDLYSSYYSSTSFSTYEIMTAMDEAIKQLIKQIKSILGYPEPAPPAPPPAPPILQQPVKPPSKKVRRTKKISYITCPKCRGTTLRKSFYLPKFFAKVFAEFNLVVSAIFSIAPSTLFWAALHAPALVAVKEPKDLLGINWFSLLTTIAVFTVLSLAACKSFAKHFAMLSRAKLRIHSFRCCACYRRFHIITRKSEHIEERVEHLVKKK